LLLSDQVFQVVVKVFSDETRASYDNASDFGEITRVFTCKLLLKSLYHCIKKLVALTGFLACVKFSRLGDGLFDLLLEHRFVLRDNEDVCDTLFHCDRNQVSLIFLLDHLVQSAHVDRVKLAFDNHDLSRRPDVHRLAHADAYPLVFSRVCAVDSQ
jgi:hypothetical protein